MEQVANKESQKVEEDSLLRKNDLLGFYQHGLLPFMKSVGLKKFSFDKFFKKLDTWNRGVIPKSKLTEFLNKLGFTEGFDLS